jgi:3'(2'), 5'-bisphosphate nucleotidase
MKYAQYVVGAIDAALRAGEAILDVYQSYFTVETKDDRSPLTQADKRSHEIIQDDLKTYGIPLVSEEGKSIPYQTRKTWNSIWIVDPLDGTKEFIKKNGEFTVNIALIEGQKPVLGVVYAPVPKSLYFASTEMGAYKLEKVEAGDFKKDYNLSATEYLRELMQRGTKMPIFQKRKIYTIVGSRSHGTKELEEFVANKKREKGNVEFVVAGSSLKICLVAEGSADIYPRLGHTMEWDTAAGQAVAECAGATMKIFESSDSLYYNKEDLLNPWFVVER